MDAAAQEINLTVLLRYPPPQADIDTLVETITQTSAILCDVTEGQIRLGKVTLRAGGCDTGNCGVGLQEADVILSPTNNEGAAATSFCPDAMTPCHELGKLGSNASISRFYLADPVTWAHELSHYIFNLPDAYRQYDCKSHRPPYDRLFECDERTATSNTLMLARQCDGPDDLYTELTTEATLPVRGQPVSCDAPNSVFQPAGVCEVSDACDALGGYGAMYDGYKNQTGATYPVCQAFDPDTCEYAWSATQWFSLYKYGEVLDEMQQAALTLEAENGGNPVFESVESGVPNAGVPDDRVGFCGVVPEIDNQIDLPNQVMLVLDRSYSMAFPDSGFEKCDPVAGCPEICGNGKDDDGNGLFDETPCQPPRMEKVRALASDYLDLVAAVPEENIEVGLGSFACGNSYDVSLRVPTAANVASDFMPAINSLVPNGSTGIVDALQAANAQLTGASKAILLLTDGFNTCGDADVAGAVEDLSDAGTRVYSVSFGPSVGSAEAAHIASGTGGRYMSAPASNGLGPVLARQFASFVQAGQLIPQLPYNLNRDLTLSGPVKSASHWASGNDAQPMVRTNRFSVGVEPDTKRLLLVLATDHDDVHTFGVRARLTGPAGSGPAFYDSSAPASTPGFTVTRRAAYMLLQIQAPNPGLWQIELSGAAGAGVSARQTGFLTVLTRGHGRLTTHADRNVIDAPGQGVRVAAYLRAGSSFVFNAQVTANLVHPNGAVEPLVVEGGSSHDDTYRIHIAPGSLTQPGVHEVRVRARAIANTARIQSGETLPDEPLPATFERTSSEIIVVSSPTCTTPNGGPCPPGAQ